MGNPFQIFRVRRPYDQLVLEQLQSIHTKVNSIMTSVSEFDQRLDAVSDRLEKAKQEILTEIQTLKNTSGDLPPEADAALARLEAKAQALDDIVPDATPTPAPTPAPAPEPPAGPDSPPAVG